MKKEDFSSGSSKITSRNFRKLINILLTSKFTLNVYFFVTEKANN